MATLYITQFSDLAIGKAQAMNLSGSKTITVAIGGTSAQSAALELTTRMVRVHTDAICSVASGADPTATTSSPRLAADQTEYFGVNGGDKIAVISNT